MTLPVPIEVPLIANGQFSPSWRRFFQLLTGTTTASGGSVAQAASKSTVVTLNAVSGQIVTSASALAAATTATFTLTNNQIEATDIVLVQLVSGNASAATYQAWTEAVSNGSVKVNIRNISAGALSEALTITFSVISSVGP